MDATSGAVRAMLQLAAGVLYAYVGRIVLRRDVSPAERRANGSFGVWWCTLAGAFALSALAQLLVIVGVAPLALMTTVFDIELLLLSVGIGGVAYYLVYLFTGDARWFARVAAFYVVVAILLEVAAFSLHPQGVDDTGAPSAAQAPLSPVIGLLLLALLLVPMLVGAVAYGSIFFRTREAVPRYRIALVALAFVLQAAWPLVLKAMGLSDRSVGLTAASTGVSVVAALLVLAAFRPPAWLAARPGHEEQLAALQQRVRDLV